LNGQAPMQEGGFAALAITPKALTIGAAMIERLT
jgi:hypothetical protein